MATEKKSVLINTSLFQIQDQSIDIYVYIGAYIR